MSHYQNQQKALGALETTLKTLKRRKEIIRISSLILEMQRNHPIGDGFIMKKLRHLQQQDSKMIIDENEDIIKWLD
jgi:hypothetical protein